MIIPLYLKAIFTVAAIVISLIAYIPYIIDMFKGKCRPHNYTWITIFLVTISVAYTQVIGGAGPAAIPTIVGCFINGFILLLSLTKYGTNDVVLIDKICLAVSVLGVLSFLVFRGQPILSLAIVSIAEVSSFIPTFRKTKNDPYSESLPSYHLLIVKLSLILLANKEYNLLTVSYPVMWGLVFILYLSLTYYWRRGFQKELN